MPELKKRRPGQPANTARDASVPQVLDTLEDMKYPRLMWQRRYLIIFVAAIFVAFGVLQVKRAVPIYTSEAVLKFDPSAGQVVDFGERSSMMYQRDEIRTAVQLIRSPAIASAVLEAVGTNQVQESPADPTPLGSLKNKFIEFLREIRYKIVSYQPPELDMVRVAEQNKARSLLTSVAVYQQPDTKLITLRVSRHDPNEAERLCHEFAVQFIRSVQQEKSESFSYAREYLSRQIQDTMKELEAAEWDVFEYSGQADIRLMEETRELAISTMVQLTEQLQTARGLVDQAQADLKNAEAAAQERLALSPPETLSALYRRRAELMDQRRALEKENTGGFRPLNLINQQLEALETEIGQQETEIRQALLDSRKVALETAQFKYTRAQERLAEQEATVATLEQKMIRFRVLQREVDSTRQIYNTLLDQYKRMEVMDDVTPNNVTIVSPATIPQAPSSPNVSRTLTSFGMMGLFAGAGLVLMLHWLDRSVKAPEMVEAQLGLPSLAVLPYLRRPGTRLIPGRGRSGPGMLINERDSKNSGRGAEAFRFLRTSINYSASDGRHQLLLVTSGCPQEGKSTVAANLGMYYGEIGERTLIIDADLKRPSQHKIWNFARMPGLSDVLTRQCELKDAIVTTHQAGVDVLPAGFNTPSTTALLESDSMKRLLAEMREQYDVIILDTAPADGMADALVLATAADAVLLVVRQGETQLETLARVQQKLHAIGANVVGAIYNNMRPSGLGSSGSSPYFYYYYSREEA